MELSNQIVILNGIQIICSKVQEIQSIEIAESVINCLNKLSNDFGDFIIKANVIESLINFIDFFEIKT